MPTERLEDLPPAAELFDYRESDEGGVPLWLPHNQGDVFAGMELSPLTGEDATGAAMLFLHPCTMRDRTGQLVPRATVVAVQPRSAKKPLDDPHNWDKRYFVIPLPDFSGRGNDSCEANMFHMGSVPHDALSREKRVAVFSEIGRAHMLHRIIFHLTRKSVPTEVLLRATRHVQAELQLQGDWTLAAWERFGGLSNEQVEAVEAEFTSMFYGPWPEAAQTGGDTIRDRLYSEREAEHEEAFALVSEMCGSDVPGSCLKP